MPLCTCLALAGSCHLPSLDASSAEFARADRSIASSFRILSTSVLEDASISRLSVTKSAALDACVAAFARADGSSRIAASQPCS